MTETTSPGPPGEGRPTVSVLVTTYQHRDFVEEALESLRAQTWSDFEVIITDDASTDGTADVVQAWLDRTGFPATFIRNPTNRGICANRNQALARARGELVCSLSGDDAYAPDRLAVQVAALRSLPDDVAGVYGDMSLVDGRGEPLPGTFMAGRVPPEGRELFRHLLLERNPVPTPAVMVRRACLDAVGPYDERLSVEDYQMWLRLTERFELRRIPGTFVRYRSHPSSLSQDPAHHARRRASTSLMLTDWIGRTPWDRELLDRLWTLGLGQLRRGEDAGARRTLRTVARHAPDVRRRAVAGVAALPLGPPALRRAAALARTVRRARPVASSVVAA